MVHVEIHDRDALGAMLLLRVARRDRRIVEQAEAHRPHGLRVMAGRARGDERIGGAPADHFVDRHDGTAARPQRRLEAAGRHAGVGIELHQTLFGRGVADLLDEVGRVAERDGLDRRRRRLDTNEVLEPLVLQRPRHRAQPVRPLRMPGRRDVLETGRMRHQKSRHGLDLTVCARLR